MDSWPVYEAKSRFSELLDACVKEGPQMITRRGAQTAVLVDVALWNRLSQKARPSFKSLLLSPLNREELNPPRRGLVKHRPTTVL